MMLNVLLMKNQEDFSDANPAAAHVTTLTGVHRSVNFAFTVFVLSKFILFLDLSLCILLCFMLL